MYVCTVCNVNEYLDLKPLFQFFQAVFPIKTFTDKISFDGRFLCTASVKQDLY